MPLCPEDRGIYFPSGRRGPPMALPKPSALACVHDPFRRAAGAALSATTQPCDAEIGDLSFEIRNDVAENVSKNSAY
jgi:hypothetical protein